MSGTLIKIDCIGGKEYTRWEKKGMPDLELLQGLTGGYMERVSMGWEGRARVAFVNEMGKAQGLAINRTASKLLRGGYEGQWIAGPMVVWVPDPPIKDRRISTTKENLHV